MYVHVIQIWPAYCFEQTLPPYRRSLDRDSPSPSERDVLDVKDQIFCMCRKNHNTRTLSLYSQVKGVLEFCADNDVALTIASRATSVQVVEQILTQFGLWDWFLCPQVYNTRKTYHFRNLSEATGLQMKDFLFFDDEVANINMVAKLGVLGCVVDKEQGLNWQVFLKGITMFYAKQRASNSLRQWLSRVPVSPAATSPVASSAVAENLILQVSSEGEACRVTFSTASTAEAEAVAAAVVAGENVGSAKSSSGSADLFMDITEEDCPDDMDIVDQDSDDYTPAQSPSLTEQIRVLEQKLSDSNILSV
jgi:hypothetical protein